MTWDDLTPEQQTAMDAEIERWIAEHVDIKVIDGETWFKLRSEDSAGVRE